MNTLEVGEKTRSFLSTSGDIKIPKETYRILGFWLSYVLTIVFLVLAITFLVIGILSIVKGDFSIHYFLFPLVLIIMACIVTYFFPFYSSITVDLTEKVVICRKYKLFFISKKIVKIDTPNIAKVYTEINHSEGFGSDNNSVDGFNLVFELNNGEKIIGLEGEIDKNFEKTKVEYFMSKFFPGITDETRKSQEIVPSVEDKQ